MIESTDGLDARILIVDDQESNVRLLEFALRRGGYVAVTSTTDPLAVRALHRQNHYDLILLDLQMPRMNGFQVMENLGGDKAAILVLSADPSQSQRALEAGAQGFLSKPFVLSEVLQRIGLILKRVPQKIEEQELLPATFPAIDLPARAI